jgi:plastocyanin
MTTRIAVRAFVVAMLTAVVAVVGGCAEGGRPIVRAGARSPGPIDPTIAALGEPADLTGRQEVEIAVIDNEYEPKVARVDAGVRVAFVNQGVNPHNVTPIPEGQFPVVATESLQPGQRAERTFAAPGVYPYYCTVHGTPTKGQRGALLVEP